MHDDVSHQVITHYSMAEDGSSSKEAKQANVTKEIHLEASGSMNNM